MMSRVWIFLFAVTALIAGVAAAPVSAQSVFATDGLGFPMEPQDGRTRGLGGAALGFPEPEISWANPAASIGLLVPGLAIAYQHDDFLAETGGTEYEGSTARFPMILAVIPAGTRLVLQAGFGSYLDQTWRLQHQDSLRIGEASVNYVDRISSDGGVTRLRFGGSYHIGGGLGVGLAADLFTGSVEREDGRIFDPSSELINTVGRASWRYRGVGYTLGAHWSPGPQGGVGASIYYPGKLEAKARSVGYDDRSYDLPVAVQLGGTGRLFQNLLVAVGGTWTGWSRVADSGPAEGSAQDTWSVQGGLEWDGIVIRDTTLPFRLGGRVGALPFGAGITDDPVSERAATLGLGAGLAGGLVRPDVAVEFGSRGDGASMDESYWRVSASVRVLGR